MPTSRPETWGDGKEVERNRGREEQDKVSEEDRKHLNGHEDRQVLARPQPDAARGLCPSASSQSIKQDPLTHSSPSALMTMSAPFQKGLDGPLDDCTPRGTLLPLPLPDRLQWARRVGQGTEAETQGQCGDSVGTVWAAHLPGMGDEVIHGNLDCFPLGDFFQSFEDEFIVKGI